MDLKISNAPHDAGALARARLALLRKLEARPELTDARVLRAMASVPRERFVSEAFRAEAYEDRALPIADGQTISQPYIVALMTQLARVGPGSRVLEIGTGCGYQTAVLAAMGAEVYTVELRESLARAARERLQELGYKVHATVGDGYRGLPEAAPFDAILVTAAPPEVPEALVAQLAPGGRLVLPVGGEEQELWVLTRTPEGVRTERVAAVRFVPMMRGTALLS